MADGKINPKEYDFFLRGGTVLDRKGVVKPPQDWITDQAWDNVTELEKMLPETFTGLPAAVSLNFKEWQHWFSSDKPMPEDAQLPGEWETKCEDLLKKMIVLRCFRPDRVFSPSVITLQLAWRAAISFKTNQQAWVKSMNNQLQPCPSFLFLHKVLTHQNFFRDSLLKKDSRCKLYLLVKARVRRLLKSWISALKVEVGVSLATAIFP